MFEKAARLKLRFESSNGALSVEDLWDLPLTGGTANKTNLDKIAMALSRQLKEEATESFVNKPPRPNGELQLKFDIVKHVIDVRMAEAEAAKNKADSKAKKDRIMEIIAKKQDAALENASTEELLKMVEAL